MDQTDVLLLSSIVNGIVDHTDAVEIERSMDGMGVLMTLRVHKDDMGKIVGKEGKTAEAIRTILRAHGMKENNRVSFKINEPLGSTRTHGAT